MNLKKIWKKYNDLPAAGKATIWFFVCTFLQKGISLITTPIFTRLLNTEQYGAYSVYISWVDIVGIFMTLGLASSVYSKKLVQLDDERERDILTSSLQGLGTLSSLIVIGVYFCFSSFFNKLFTMPTELVVAMFLSIVATMAFNFWAIRQRVTYRYKPLIAMSIFTSIAKPVLGITAILLFPDFKVHARIYTIVGVEIIAYTGIFIRQFTTGKQFFNKNYWKYALAFVLPLIPHYLSQRVLSQSDRLMINSMIGSSEAGIYSLAFSIGMLLNLVLTALENTLAPWTYQCIKNKSFEKTREISILVILAIAVLGLAFIAITPELISLFATNEYKDAIWIVPAFAMDAFLIAIYTLFIYFEYYFEKTRYIMIATMLVAAINVVLNYIFIKRVGYIAAAYTSVFCYIIYCMVHCFVYKAICKKELNGFKPYNLKAFLSVSLVFMVIALGIVSCYPFTVLRYFVIVLLFILVFVKRKLLTEAIRQLR